MYAYPQHAETTRTRFPLLARRCGWLALLLVVLAVPARAEPLTFLARAGYAPYSFDNNGQPRGIDCEVFLELARRMDMDVNIRFLPQAKIPEVLQRGDVHGVVALHKLPEMTSTLVYALRQPLRVSEYDIFYHGGAPLKYLGVASLNGKRLALPQGVPLPESLEQTAPGAEILPVTAEPDGVRLLLQRKVDAFVGQTRATFDLLGEMGMTSTVRAVGTTFSTAPVYMAVASNSSVERPEDLARLLELMLGDMLVDGTYRKIQSRYIVN